MLLGKIFERFANGSPVTVMLRGTLEYALRPELLDQRFAEVARHQYTHKRASARTWRSPGCKHSEVGLARLAWQETLS